MRLTIATSSSTAALLLLLCALTLFASRIDVHPTRTSKELNRDRQRLLASLDPKSIEVKKPHLFDLEEDYSRLRFLFLGTSRTFGSELGTDRLTAAFPYLISPQSVNLAIPGSTPINPLKCSYSMIQPVENNTAFDVIVLEYDVKLHLLVDLARRLRQRYPRALIIAPQMWILRRFVHTPSGKDMQTWVNDQQRAMGRKLPQKQKAIDVSIATLVWDKTQASDWEYTGPTFEQSLLNALQAIDVIITKPHWPKNAHEAVGMGSWFFADMHHFSKTGHEFIADTILNELREKNFRTFHDGTLNEWAEKDQCESWFQNGVTTLLHDPNLIMKQFTPGKFALEAHAKQVWIKVFNHDSEPRGLNLDRLVAAPDCRYPDAEISVVGSAASPVSALCPKDGSWPWQVHVAQEVFLGEIPPGESTILVRLLHGTNKPWPFRIIGVSVGSRAQLILPPRGGFGKDR
jgi:lysophospholipase L1-like esterase